MTTRLRLPFDVELSLPGSKSVANRALVAAALGKGRVRIVGATACDDVRAMISGLQALGFAVTEAGPGVVVVDGGLPSEARGGTIDCGNAGTALRFLLSVAALVPGAWVLDGDVNMRSRPIKGLVDAWRGLGLEIDDTNGCPPVRFQGGTARGGQTSLCASASGQFLSSLLLVGSRLPEGLVVRLNGELASPGYVELSLEVLRAFGVEVQQAGEAFSVDGGAGANPSDFLVEADWSAAGAWWVLADMTGSRFADPALRPDSKQPDRGLPAQISALRGDGERLVDVAGMPDQLMNLAVLAARRAGQTRFVGAANLRRKECDRLAVTARELGRLGIDAVVEEDGLLITGARSLSGAAVDPENDHRIAMALALAGALSDGIAITDRGCVAKSYPAFFEDLEAARRSPRCLAVIGMRWAGKTMLGRALSTRLELILIDIDALFEEREGDIAAFVDHEGWDRFRSREAELVDESLRPGRLVILGGGALETESVRDAVRERATVLLVEEARETLKERAGRHDGGRPSVTGLPILEEIDTLLARRRPFFDELADITLPAGESLEARCLRAVEQLEAPCTW
jgi:3-phosphoshikimate 1-carboxyvinyltransferase